MDDPISFSEKLTFQHGFNVPQNKLMAEFPPGMTHFYLRATADLQELSRKWAALNLQDARFAILHIDSKPVASDLVYNTRLDENIGAVKNEVFNTDYRIGVKKEAFTFVLSGLHQDWTCIICYFFVDSKTNDYEYKYMISRVVTAIELTGLVNISVIISDLDPIITSALTKMRDINTPLNNIIVGDTAYKLAHCLEHIYKRLYVKFMTVVIKLGLNIQDLTNPFFINNMLFVDIDKRMLGLSEGQINKMESPRTIGLRNYPKRFPLYKSLFLRNFEISYKKFKKELNSGRINMDIGREAMNNRQRRKFIFNEEIDGSVRFLNIISSCLCVTMEDRLHNFSEELENELQELYDHVYEWYRINNAMSRGASSLRGLAITLQTTINLLREQLHLNISLLHNDKIEDIFDGIATDKLKCTTKEFMEGLTVQAPIINNTDYGIPFACMASKLTYDHFRKIEFNQLIDEIHNNEKIYLGRNCYMNLVNFCPHCRQTWTNQNNVNQQQLIWEENNSIQFNTVMREVMIIFDREYPRTRFQQRIHGIMLELCNNGLMELGNNEPLVRLWLQDDDHLNHRREVVHLFIKKLIINYNSTSSDGGFLLPTV